MNHGQTKNETSFAKQQKDKTYSILHIINVILEVRFLLLIRKTIDCLCYILLVLLLRINIIKPPTPYEHNSSFQN